MTNRPTLMYAAMLVLFSVGLWAIIQIGATLTPPPDLDGEWNLEPIGKSATPSSSTLTIEQSGQFFRLRFAPSGPRLNLKLVSYEFGGTEEQATVHLELANDQWKVIAVGPVDRSTMTFDLIGPITESFKATRPQPEDEIADAS